MDHASITIAICLGAAIGLFAMLTVFLLYDEQRMTSATAARVTTSPGPASPTAPPVSRFRLGVVALTFLVWSLLISEHLRSRR
jgi:hypothetical protein